MGRLKARRKEEEINFNGVDGRFMWQIRITDVMNTV
jgi:hypothetical protein